MGKRWAFSILPLTALSSLAAGCCCWRVCVNVCRHHSIAQLIAHQRAGHQHRAHEGCIDTRVELALFFYNKGEKCIDDGHDLSDTARLSVSVRLLHTTTAQHRQYRWGSPAATAKQPKGSSSLATTTTTTTDWRKKKLDKNWAGPPLFPCRWIGVSFNIPSSNIASIFFLLHIEEISRQNVSVAV